MNQRTHTPVLSHQEHIGVGDASSHHRVLSQGAAVGYLGELFWLLDIRMWDKRSYDLIVALSIFFLQAM